MTAQSFFRGRSLSTFLLLLAAISWAGAASLTVPLNVPQLQQLQAVLDVEGEPVEVNLAFVHAATGKITLAPESTVDGQPVAGRATMKNQAGVIIYTVNAATATKPKTVVTFKGVAGSGLARATYSGPRGRAKITDQSVTLTTAEAVAQADFTASVGNRGKLSGSGTISAYDVTPETPSKLSGTVTPAKLTFSLKQGNRLISFKGTPQGDLYVGTLKATILPSRTTITPYEVPASAFFPPNNAAAFQGVVLLSSNAAPAASEGVTVTVKSDLDDDGTFASGESITVITDENGRYYAELQVADDRPVLLEISQPGYAKFLNSYKKVSAGAVVTKNATLQVLNRVSVTSGAAESTDGKLKLTGLPPAISNLSARVFNPNTETAQFPGEFADSDRNLLVSSVFAAIEASDAAGGSVTDLGTNAILSMEVPRDTWSTMGDLAPGSGRIDVPLYYFDEDTGEWKRSLPDGWLETADGVVIAESELPSILNGSYAGRVYAVGRVTHLSYWNCDWPIETHACLQAVVVDESGTPVSGATVTVRGITYTGTTSPQVTGADGSICADIMRSEAVGEDVDRDGTTGETQRVTINVRWGTNVYSFGPFNSPQAQGSCPAGGCTDLGNLVLSATNQLSLTLCTINGRMTYSGTTLFGSSPPLQPGDPIEGAIVYAFDEEVTDAAYECVASGACTLFATTAADGTFSITTMVLSGVSIYGYKTGADASGYEYYFGITTLESCPAGQVALAADYWSARFIFLTLTGAGLESGTATIVNDQLTVSLVASNGTYYIGTQAQPATRPTAIGPWFTVPLMRATSTGTTSAGTASFTVTGLSPLSGTWTTSTAGLSGAFIDEESGDGTDAAVRIEAPLRPDRPAATPPPPPRPRTRTESPGPVPPARLQ